jgi:hypothetical protein
MWVPTPDKDEHGKPLYRRFGGKFTRLTLYSIGDTHLTEKDLNSGEISFDFDLNDTVYVQLRIPAM